MSTITRTPGELVTVHTYTAGEPGWRSNSHVIELPNRLVLIDAPLLVDDAHTVRRGIDHLNKPLDRVVVTHAHPDHFATAARFGAPVYALDGVRTAIEASGNQQIRGAYALTGLSPSVVPDGPEHIQTIEGRRDTLDGVDFEYSTYRDAEASTQLVIGVAAESLLFVGDLAYSEVHPFLAGRHAESWRSILAELDVLPYRSVLPGHGAPNGRAVFGATADYLKFAGDSLTNATTPAELDQLLDSTYPSYTGRSMHAMQNYLLFPPEPR